MHPRSREVLLWPGGVAVPDGHPVTANVGPGGSCTILLPASGSSMVLEHPPDSRFQGGPLRQGLDVGSLPAPLRYEREQRERWLPRAPCPNSRLIPGPAPTRPQDQGGEGWVGS